MRKRGYLQRAEVLAHCINALITEKRSNALNTLADCSAQKLWNAVKKLETKRLLIAQTTSFETRKLLMSYFAEVSSKENYDVHEFSFSQCI